jgi:hypothetical protein
MMDVVCEALEIPAAEIESPPSFGARICADFMRDIGRVAGHFVTLLDVHHVLDLDELERWMLHRGGTAAWPWSDTLGITRRWAINREELTLCAILQRLALQRLNETSIKGGHGS